jgi:hypothetical protein
MPFTLLFIRAGTHLDKRSTSVRMLFIDYSSAYNTIVLSKLDTKVRALGLDTTLCNWILDILTGRPKAVKMGNNTSSTLTLNTAPPLIVCSQPSVLLSIIKFADDTTVVGLITNNDESAYREELSELALLCQDNNFSLNISKAKELIVVFRMQRWEHAPIHINGTAASQHSKALKKFCMPLRVLQILPLHHR